MSCKDSDWFCMDFIEFTYNFVVAYVLSVFPGEQNIPGFYYANCGRCPNWPKSSVRDLLDLSKSARPLK